MTALRTPNFTKILTSVTRTSQLQIHENQFRTECMVKGCIFAVLNAVVPKIEYLVFCPLLSPNCGSCKIISLSEIQFHVSKLRLKLTLVLTVIRDELKACKRSGLHRSVKWTVIRESHRDFGMRGDSGGLTYTGKSLKRSVTICHQYHHHHHHNHHHHYTPWWALASFSTICAPQQILFG
jgi:hypothetical protein